MSILHRERILLIMEVLRRLTEPTVSYDLTLCSAFNKFYSDSWVQRHGDEPLLPGLNYTQRQLFWISGANVWCSKHRPKALKLSVITGAHSPDKFRVQVCCYKEINQCSNLTISGCLFKYGRICKGLSVQGRLKNE